MGHDITAYKQDGSNVYIRIPAWDGATSHLLYECLNAQEASGGASGYGVEITFTPNQLKKAKEKYLYFKDEPFEVDNRGNEMIKFVAEMFGTTYESKEVTPCYEDLDDFFNKIQDDNDVTIRFA